MNTVKYENEEARPIAAKFHSSLLSTRRWDEDDDDDDDLDRLIEELESEPEDHVDEGNTNPATGRSVPAHYFQTDTRVGLSTTEALKRRQRSGLDDEIRRKVWDMFFYHLNSVPEYFIEVYHISPQKSTPMVP